MPDRDQSNPNTNLAKSLVCFRYVGAESCLSNLRSVGSHFSAHNGIWSGRAFFPFSKMQQGTAMHTCSPGTQEAEAGILLQLRSLKQSELGVRIGVWQQQLLLIIFFLLLPADEHI